MRIKLRRTGLAGNVPSVDSFQGNTFVVNVADNKIWELIEGKVVEIKNIEYLVGKLGQGFDVNHFLYQNTKPKKNFFDRFLDWLV